MKHFLLLAILLTGCQKEQGWIPDAPPQQDAGGFVIDSTDELPAPALPVQTLPEPAPPVPQAPPKPMRLEVVSGPKHVVTIHTTDPCDPCVRLKKKYGDGNERITIIWDPTLVKNGPDSYPAIRWKDSKGVERYPSRNGLYYAPDTLDELLQVIERNNTPPAASPAASKVAGFGWGTIKLHGRSHVVAAIDFFRKTFGESPTTLAWKRNGIQTVPLRAKQTVTMLQLLGTDGRVVISAPGSKIPLKEGELSYRHLGGNKWKLGAETVIDLAEDGTVKAGSGQKVGEITTVLTIIGAMRSVWSLLHPVADLIIGGDVSATFTLTGDMLAVDFRDMPGVRLTWIINVFPQIRRAELTPDKLRLLTTSPWPFRELTILILD
jgi:hypothetical protein